VEFSVVIGTVVVGCHDKTTTKSSITTTSIKPVQGTHTNTERQNTIPNKNVTITGCDYKGVREAICGVKSRPKLLEDVLPRHQ